MNLKRILDSLHRLIAPPVQNCLTCGKVTNISTLIHGICHSCYNAIPWIRHPRCSMCGRQIGCPDCSREDVQKGRFFICNRSAVAYNPMMREWLAQFKYRGNERYSELLSMMLEKAYTRLVHDYQQISSDSKWTIDVITCVPVSETRLQERGFNQAEVLAVRLGEMTNLPFRRLIIRERHTDKQSFKSRNSRIRDMDHTFECDPDVMDMLQNVRSHQQTPRISRALRILLIDDIYTTGSTVNACARILIEVSEGMSYPVEVYSLTWARS